MSGRARPTGDAPGFRDHPYHFRIWGWRDQFTQAGDTRVTSLEVVATDAIVGAMARQLLGCDEVLLMEANPVLKDPGGLPVPWHQDYSYWPLAEPSAVTFWIALEDVGPDQGSMAVVPGSHRWGERLPVSLGDADTGTGGRTGPLGQTFMERERPGVPAIPAEPRDEHLPVVSYRLRAGECGVHHPLLWHSSTTNRTAPRQVVILRYVAAGTVWLGETRGLYRDVGCPDGDPLDGRHFPAVRATF